MLLLLWESHSDRERQIPWSWPLVPVQGAFTNCTGVKRLNKRLSRCRPLLLAFAKANMATKMSRAGLSLMIVGTRKGKEDGCDWGRVSVCLQRFSPLVFSFILDSQQGRFYNGCKKTHGGKRRRGRVIFRSWSGEIKITSALQVPRTFGKQELQEIKMMGPTVPDVIFLSSMYEHQYIMFLFWIFKLNITSFTHVCIFTLLIILIGLWLNEEVECTKWCQMTLLILRFFFIFALFVFHFF